MAELRTARQDCTLPDTHALPLAQEVSRSDHRLMAEAERRPAFNPAERRRGALLARTLETEVIPRLLLAQRDQVAPAYIESVGDAAAPGAEEISVLTGLVMHNDLPGAVAYLGALRGRGIAIERLYLELLAPVARRLGVMWEEDVCDFTTVVGSPGTELEFAL